MRSTSRSASAARLALDTALAVLLVLGWAARPASSAQENYVFGTAFDAITKVPIASVCVVLGPALVRCTTTTAADGSCRKVANLQPGTSYADVPNNDLDLPDDTQFSVVVRSFGGPVVSVVNEHQGGGDRAEAMSYDGYSQGASSVFLPNITRRFFGYVTPFIIQNVGQNATIAQARFVSFDGSAPEIVVQRTILAGRSQFVDPNSEPGLVDGHQYAVTVTAGGPVAVVVNTHNDAPSMANPVAYSDDGLVIGGGTIYGAYAAKNAQGIGRVATIVVQNMGAPGMPAVSPNLSFRPLGGGGQTQSFELGAIVPGSSRAFDPRYGNGDVKQPLCGSQATSACLADGEYSFIVAAPPAAASAQAGASLAAVVNVISPATAMGYSATPTPARRMYLPNVTRTLGGPAGWTTPIVVQSASATTGQLSFYRFSDQKLVLTQPLSLAPGASVRIDPRDPSALADDTQYSVVVDGPMARSRRSSSSSRAAATTR